MTLSGSTCSFNPLLTGTICGESKSASLGQGSVLCLRPLLMMRERALRASLATVLRRDRGAAQVFAVSPVSDSSEADRRPGGSPTLPPRIVSACPPGLVLSSTLFLTSPTPHTAP